MLYGVGLLLIIVFFNRYIYDGTEKFKSTLDGMDYRVRPGPNGQQKADLLAFIRLKLQTLVDSLQTDSTMVTDPAVQRLIRNWNKGVSIKEIGKMETDAAYVINKQNMAFCLQDLPVEGSNTKTTSFPDTNLISYVCIHELAHVMSIETGHGSEFIENFDKLLRYAQKVKYKNPFSGQIETLYTPLNQVPGTSDNYCGVPLVNSMV
jgi:hypothetical protein